MSELKAEISKYANAFSLENNIVLLNDELDSIANGKYKSQIVSCRQLIQVGNKPAYNNLKKKLPSLTFSGTFSGAHKEENLLNYSNYIVIDIDNIETDRVEALKESIFTDKYVFAAWISPSGNGIKLLIKIASNADDHALCFLCLLEYFKANHNIDIDKSGSDVCRLCFVSYDERLLLKNDNAVFDFNDYLDLIEDNQEPKEKISTKIPAAKKEVKAKINSASQRALFWKTEGKNIGRNRDTIEKIIKFLKKNNKSITYSYNDWFRVALAIANSFTYEVGQDYYLQLCKLDKEKHDDYKSKYLLEYCYRNRKLDRVEFSTIVYLAIQQGFK